MFCIGAKSVQHLLKDLMLHHARITPSLTRNFRGTPLAPPHCAIPPSVPMHHLHSYHEDASHERQVVNAIKIFQAGIEAVLPNQMVKDALHIKDGILSVSGKTYQLQNNVYIIAFGKAVAGMVQAAEKALGEHVVCGIASVPVGMKEALEEGGKNDVWPAPSSKVKLIEGAQNNIPDKNSLSAAGQISELAESLTEGDLLLVLISGGGSALLPAPIPPVTLHQKQHVTKLLASRGASIQELNIVRSSISLLKGGKLAQLAKPAKVISLILSDIIGDPIDLIASGPTVPSSFIAKDSLDIISKYTNYGEVPDVVRSVINNHGNLASEQFNHVNNVIVGNNLKAVGASKETAEMLGFATFVLSTSISGEARVVGKHFAELAQVICTVLQNPDSSAAELTQLTDLLKLFNATDAVISSIQKKLVEKKSLCLIGAGETTVTICGNGKGGRNQEMALAAAVAMDTGASAFKNFHVTFLSGGTDGQDGPTDAAGAWVNPGIVREALTSNRSPIISLEQNDSYTFFSNMLDGRNLLKIGLTGTNVMDVQILLVTPKT